MENTATPAVTPTAVALRYGLLTGLVSIICAFILYTSGQETNTALGYASLIIPIVVGIVLAHKEYKKQQSGFMSYGQGVGIGTLLSVVSGLLGAIFTYVYREFIDPTMAQRTMDQMRAKFEAAGNMSEAQIDNALAMSQKFSTGPISIGLAVLVFAIFGLLLSLIISAITKHNRPEFE